MGTTDNFDNAALTVPVSTMRESVLPASNAQAGNLTMDQSRPFTGRFRFCTLSGQLGALGSLGTSTTPVAGTTYFADVFVPVVGFTVTGIGILNAATVGTDKYAAALYGSAGGAALANTLAAGTTTAGADAFQEIALTATYQILKPGRFWIGVQLNGTTDRFRTIAAATWIDVLTKSTAGTFGTFPSLTVPTTFTATVGPIAYLY